MRGRPKHVCPNASPEAYNSLRFTLASGHGIHRYVVAPQASPRMYGHGQIPTFGLLTSFEVYELAMT